MTDHFLDEKNERVVCRIRGRKKQIGTTARPDICANSAAQNRGYLQARCNLTLTHIQVRISTTDGFPASQSSERTSARNFHSCKYGIEIGSNPIKGFSSNLSLDFSGRASSLICI